MGNMSCEGDNNVYDCLVRLQTDVDAILNVMKAKQAGGNCIEEKSLIDLNTPKGESILKSTCNKRPQIVVQSGKFVTALYVQEDHLEVGQGQSDLEDSFVTCAGDDELLNDDTFMSFMPDRNKENENVDDNIFAEPYLPEKVTHVTKHSTPVKEKSVKLNSSFASSITFAFPKPQPPRATSIYDFKNSFSNDDSPPLQRPKRRLLLSFDSPSKQKKNNRLSMTNGSEKRIEYTRKEIEMIYKGLSKYGKDFKSIWLAYKSHFHPSRTPIKLYDKWRHDLRGKSREMYIKSKFYFSGNTTML